MRFTSLIAPLAAAALASAQNQTMVAVGAEQDSPGGIFQFNPNQITAANGTVITFQFSGIPGNHSITQSTFDSPCEPMPGGFDSGWVLIAANTSTLPTWELTITNDATPIWFYCKQLLPSPHCIAGMVGVINVKPGANSFSAYQQKAMSASESGQGQGGLVGVGASASALPNVGSGATQFLGSSASATAPGGSGAASGSGGAGASNTGTTGGAVSLGLNINLLVLLFGVLAGGAMVL
ncbi:Cupredoxin [Mycena crocata]|nr:Cupredoxin [Mycena crocata]